jgi:IS66 Orf2 like protein
VIGPSGAVRVVVATKPVDFRKGMEGLATLVRESMGADPFSGAVYVFRAKRADRIKLVFWDGTGLCLFAKTPGIREQPGSIASLWPRAVLFRSTPISEPIQRPPGLRITTRTGIGPYPRRAFLY